MHNLLVPYRECFFAAYGGHAGALLRRPLLSHAPHSTPATQRKVHCRRGAIVATTLILQQPNQLRPLRPPHGARPARGEPPQLHERAMSSELPVVERSMAALHATAAAVVQSRRVKIHQHHKFTWRKTRVRGAWKNTQGPAGARRRSLIENRRPLRHGRHRGTWRSGRRFGRRGLHRALAGPSIETSRADTPRTQVPRGTRRRPRGAARRGA